MLVASQINKLFSVSVYTNTWSCVQHGIVGFENLMHSRMNFYLLPTLVTVFMTFDLHIVDIKIEITGYFQLLLSICCTIYTEQE